MEEIRMSMKGINSDLSAYIYSYNGIVRVVYTIEYTTKHGSTTERTYDVKKTTIEQAINYLKKKGYK
jgi:hypothetical protein